MRTSLFVVAALVAAGCVEPSESVGTVGVALVANDGTGASYRLTEGARLQLISGSYFDELSLDGDDAFVRLDVPAGDYSAELVHDAGHATQWPLERTDVDGTTETVIATLVTPMPAALTVPADGQANLVLSFQVPGFGPITFDHGTIEVTIDVSEATAAGVTTEIGGLLTANTVTADPAAPAVLATRLPAVGEDADMTLIASVTGDWFQTSSVSACAQARMDGVGSGHPGVIDLILESIVTEEAQICVYDTVPPRIEILTLRQGEASYPTFADLGGSNWLFVTLLSADLPASVFDGETLDIDPAVGNFQVPGTAFLRASVRPPGAPLRQHWYRGSFSGDVNLQVNLTL